MLVKLNRSFIHEWPLVMWLRNVSRYTVAKVHRALTAYCVYPIQKAHVDMGPAHVCTRAVHTPVRVPPLTWTGGWMVQTWTWAVSVGAHVGVRFFLWILWEWWHITPQMGPQQGGPHATSDLKEMEKRLRQQQKARDKMRDKEWNKKQKARDKEWDGKLNALRVENQQQHKDMQSVQSIVVVSLSWLINIMCACFTLHYRQPYFVSTSFHRRPYVVSTSLHRR